MGKKYSREERQSASREIGILTSNRRGLTEEDHQSKVEGRKKAKAFCRLREEVSAKAPSQEHSWCSGGTAKRLPWLERDKQGRKEKVVGDEDGEARGRSCRTGTYHLPVH